MEKGYVKWMLVLLGITLMLRVAACTPGPFTGEEGERPDTIIAVSEDEGGEDKSALSGEYVFDNQGGSGVLKVFGPTPSQEIIFSLVMTTDSGCMIERSGRAPLVEKNKAMYHQVNTNCKLELNFNGPAVEVIQNNCPERDSISCSFNGIYTLSLYTPEAND